MDLFTPVATRDRLHPNFIRTLAPSASPVRDVLSAWAEGVVDRDGKFVREFQTTYNSAFWELYLFAVLKDLGVQVDLVHSSPDFVCVDPSFIIEAAIASHAQNDTPEWRKDIRTVIHNDTDAANRQTTIRLSNAFIEKAGRYTKSYSKLPHAAGKPFIVALANYGTQDFALSGDVPMQHLLYDPAEEGRILKPNGSPVELGLFRSEL